MIDKRTTEWNIHYAVHDGNDGVNEGFVVLPSIWKVAMWIIRKGYNACQIYIWTSSRIKQGGNE